MEMGEGKVGSLVKIEEEGDLMRGREESLTCHPTLPYIHIRSFLEPQILQKGQPREHVEIPNA
jgi:hypothetical protein